VLLVLGLVIAGVGLVWVLAPSLPWLLGRLPGAIRIERENFRFYVPPGDGPAAEPALEHGIVTGAAVPGVTGFGGVSCQG
jgi:hypothetical protein